MVGGDDTSQGSAKNVATDGEEKRARVTITELAQAMHAASATSARKDRRRFETSGAHPDSEILYAGPGVQLLNDRNSQKPITPASPAQKARESLQAPRRKALDA